MGLDSHAVRRKTLNVVYFTAGLAVGTPMKPFTQLNNRHLSSSVYAWIISYSVATSVAVQQQIYNSLFEKRPSLELTLLYYHYPNSVYLTGYAT